MSSLSLQSVQATAKHIESVVLKTPLQLNTSLSRKFNANIYLKREDLQIVRSYKLRGAYNMMSSLPKEKLDCGVVCASAGNHAQGFAFSCKALNIKGTIFMPSITPKQKITQTKMFGEDNIEIILTGDTYDDCANAAKKFTAEKNMTFVHPFDDEKVIEGQATVGLEIYEQLTNIDYVIIPIGGGGLCAGVGSFIKTVSPHTKIIGTEPEGAPSMTEALKAGRPVELTHIDRFVDGAAVKRVGDITFEKCHPILDDVILVPEGKICTTILELYNKDAIVVEPAGALSVAALSFMEEKIKGKNVVCIISGSNNDIDRMQEIKERSLQYEGLKHYFLIDFAQRPGALKNFVNNVLGPDDDITRFEYMQKTNKESGPALVGIELKNKKDYQQLISNLQESSFSYTELNKSDALFSYLV
ncbi:threonine ammonia-lyase IlvA [Niabella ginsengisoli]|uniref:L-threonine dehydratase n=1 Tax=Niabella ginsengisoli TaxID=522298 RepID=A0ABS9SJA6_9BACT|nr:threonine ammonia-lyase IlvA [Niabella ginsengisoli]MCH5598453.1 threonine ammonia-lyase IlvA [Niabella ginsengisoli]